MIHDPSVSITLDATSDIKIGVVSLEIMQNFTVKGLRKQP